MREWDEYVSPTVQEVFSQYAHSWSVLDIDVIGEFLKCSRHERRPVWVWNQTLA